MVTTPLGLLPVWAEEFEKFYIDPEMGKERNPYKFSLKIAHADYSQFSY